MFKKLIPRDELFFDHFDQIADNVVRGVGVLRRAISEHERQRYTQEIRTIEHQTDILVQNATAHLHRTFVTPLEREDIRRLLVRLDDVLDLANAAGNSLELYQPERFPPELDRLADVLVESATLVREMVGLLRHLGRNVDRILSLTVEVGRLENEADQIRRMIMARLMREEKNPIELIKWKDILHYLENATDLCEDVADVVKGIVIENS